MLLIILINMFPVFYLVRIIASLLKKEFITDMGVLKLKKRWLISFAYMVFNILS